MVVARYSSCRRCSCNLPGAVVPSPPITTFAPIHLSICDLTGCDCDSRVRNLSCWQHHSWQIATHNEHFRELRIQLLFSLTLCRRRKAHCRSDQRPFTHTHAPPPFEIAGPTARLAEALQLCGARCRGLADFWGPVPRPCSFLGLAVFPCGNFLWGHKSLWGFPVGPQVLVGILGVL